MIATKCQKYRRHKILQNEILSNNFFILQNHFVLETRWKNLIFAMVIDKIAQSYISYSDLAKQWTMAIGDYVSLISLIYYYSIHLDDR